MSDAILAFNAGSSSIKFALFEISDQDLLQLSCKGSFDEHDAEPRLVVKDSAGSILFEKHQDHADKENSGLFSNIIDWVERHLGRNSLAAVGHRVVHGGRDFASPIRITRRIVEALDSL